jgi:hypothetical protein
MSGEVEASLDAITQTRAAIGRVVAMRLAAFPDLPDTGPGLQAATERDSMLQHLRRTDLELCHGYAALEHRRIGESGVD